MVIEYEDVLNRLSQKISLNTQQKAAIIDRICQISVHQSVYFLWRPFLRDPKDDMVLEVAMTSRAQYIITFNSADFGGIANFGIEAITPGDFLTKL